MTQPRKSLAELLAERAAAKAEAKPAPPTILVPDSEPAPSEPSPEPEPIVITVEPAPMPAEDHEPERLANVSPAAPRPRMPPRPYNPIPSNTVCGARTRAGTPCQSRALYRSGRCKNHGGLSTGPRTAEGKTKVARNGLAPKRKPKAKPMGDTENLGSDLTKPDIGC